MIRRSKHPNMQTEEQARFKCFTLQRIKQNRRSWAPEREGKNVQPNHGRESSGSQEEKNKRESSPESQLKMPVERGDSSIIHRESDVGNQQLPLGLTKGPDAGEHVATASKAHWAQGWLSPVRDSEGGSTTPPEDKTEKCTQDKDPPAWKTHLQHKGSKFWQLNNPITIYYLAPLIWNSLLHCLTLQTIWVFY